MLITRMGVMAVLLLLGACVPMTPYSGVGARIQAGAIEVLVPLCGDQRVTSIELVHSVDVVVGNDDDETLWRITAEEPTSEESFRIGLVPEGFSEDVSLRSIPETDPVAVTVGSDGFEQTLGFSVEDLEQDRILMDGVYFDERDFRSAATEANSACP